METLAAHRDRISQLLADIRAVDAELLMTAAEKEQERRDQQDDDWKRDQLIIERDSDD